MSKCFLAQVANTIAMEDSWVIAIVHIRELHTHATYKATPYK